MNDFQKLLLNLLDKYPYKENIYICNWYNSDFLLTITPIRKYIEKEIHKIYPNLEKEEIIYKLKEYVELTYHKEINKIEKKLSSLPELIQRTPEWYEFRKKLITGSEAGSFLGISGLSSAINSLNNKIGLPATKPNFNSPAIQHGTNYENVAKRVYELRNQVSVLELGCIESPSSFIGASPDGIIFEYHSNDWSSWSKYGRMLEIKCPYSRIINDKIKPEYEIQILQQQYTCRLPICDFLEVGIIDSDHAKGIEGVIPYYDLDDLLRDQLDISKPEWKQNIKNKNIPWQNLNKNGLEKGIIIVAYYEIGKNDSGYIEYKNETIIYPIEKLYKKEEINNWLLEQRKILEQNGIAGLDVKLWKIYNYSVKTKIYDQKIYENDYIPKLENVWKKISTLRELPEEKQMEIIKSWTDISDLHNSNLFGKKNIVNIESTNNLSSISNIKSLQKKNKLEEIQIENKQNYNSKARNIINSKKTTSQTIDDILNGIDFNSRFS